MKNDKSGYRGPSLKQSLVRAIPLFLASLYGISFAFEQTFLAVVLLVGAAIAQTIVINDELEGAHKDFEEVLKVVQSFVEDANARTEKQ